MLINGLARAGQQPAKASLAAATGAARTLSRRRHLEQQHVSDCIGLRSAAGGDRDLSCPVRRPSISSKRWRRACFCRDVGHRRAARSRRLERRRLVAGSRVRLEVRLEHQADSRRNLARLVRRPARRGDGAVAGICENDPADRTRPGPVVRLGTILRL